MAGDGRIDLFARHALLDVRVVGDGFERDVGHGLVDEAAANALARMCQLVVVEDGGHQSLLGQRQRHAGGVAGDPAPAPLLGDEGGGAAAAGGVEDQIAGVGGHEDASLEPPLERSAPHSFSTETADARYQFQDAFSFITG